MEEGGEAAVASLGAAISGRDAGAFLGTVRERLLKHPSQFKTLREEVLQAAAGVEDESLSLFILDCLEVLQLESSPGAAPGSNTSSGAVPTILLDILPTLRGAEASAGAGRAATLFLACCRSGESRLAVKLAAAFGLGAEQFSAAQQHAIVDTVAALLDSSRTAAQGVALLSQFPALQQYFDLPAVVEDLVAGGQDAVAGRWAADLGPPFPELYIEACLRFGLLRSASRGVARFLLEERFPDVEATYRASTLERLCGKGLWGVAATFVADDRGLQESLIRAMAVAGEVTLAGEYCTSLFGLDPGAFQIDDAAVAAERLRRTAVYLQPRLAAGSVHWVDSAEGLAGLQAAMEGLAAAPHRHSAPHAPLLPAEQQRGDAAEAQHHPSPADLLPAVGLDVEWKPDREDGEGASSPASTMQVATDDAVFVIDLLALGRGAPAELSAALAPMLGAAAVFKLGCGLASDLGKLAKSYPAVAAFHRVPGCVDLSTLWRDRHLAPGGKRVPASYRKRAGEISLSGLAEAVVGRPLDKCMQVSDWERRPLSEQQLTYAALDAHVAVLILRGLGQLHHALGTRQGLDRAAFVWTTGGPANKPAAGGRELGNGGGDGDHGGGGSAARGSGEPSGSRGEGASEPPRTGDSGGGHGPGGSGGALASSRGGSLGASSGRQRAPPLARHPGACVPLTPRHLPRRLRFPICLVHQLLQIRWIC